MTDPVPSIPPKMDKDIWETNVAGRVWELDEAYLVRQHGAYVEGVNGCTKKIEFSDENAKTVIAEVLGALTPARTVQEKIILKGDFEIDSALTIDAPTILEVTGSVKLADGANSKMFNVTGDNVDILSGLIDGNKANQTNETESIFYVTGSKFNLHRSHIKNGAYCNVEFVSGSENNEVSFCTLEGSNHNVVLASGVPHVTAAFNTVLNAGTDAFDIRAGSHYAKIMFNNIQGLTIGNAVYFREIYHSLAKGNIMTGIIGTAIRFANNGYANKAIGNSMYDIGTYAVYIQDSSECIVALNNMEKINYHAILLNNASYNKITDNILKDPCQNESGANYAHIRLTGADSDYNDLTNNKFLHSLTNKPRYIIHGDNAGQLGNVIEENDLRNAQYTVAKILDLGTSIIKRNRGYVTENKGSSTGTGSQQTIPHGCDFTPTEDEVFLSERTTGDAVPKQTSSPDATNIYITATADKDYNWKVEKA